MARLKAEAEAEHATRRLAVAQEQISEYAQQREGEAGALLGEVQAVEQALASALEQAGSAAAGTTLCTSGSSSSSLAALSTHVQARPCRGQRRSAVPCMPPACCTETGRASFVVKRKGLPGRLQALKTRLSEAVSEAQAFAAQQKADAERTKRTYSQVTAGLLNTLITQHELPPFEQEEECTSHCGKETHQVCVLAKEGVWGCRQIWSLQTPMWR